MAKAAAIFGGLLSGVGKGMMEQDQQRREQAERLRQEALERVRRREEMDFMTQRDQAQRDFQTQRDEYQGGLLSRTATDESGNLFGITSNLETVDLGINTGVRASSSQSGGGDELSGITMSAEEKRLYDEVKHRYTDANTNRVDWTAFVQHLRSMPEERGGSRWNEIADNLTGAVGTNMSAGEAREQAVREARQRKGLFSRRASEFPETGGDEQRWIEMRSQELLGGSQAQQGQDATSGMGSQANPYKPVTEDDFAQVPSGMIYLNPADGRLYRKK